MTTAKFSLQTINLNASFSIGFRPLYLLATLWAICSVSVWVFAPAAVNLPLSGMYWHAHEMLWGFIGTIAVGFLLTASATWTGINPLFGRPLALLCLVWLASRLLFFIGGTSNVLTAAALDSLFYLAAAIAIARSVILSKNWRNLMMPVMLIFLAATQFLFAHFATTYQVAAMWQSFNVAWLVMAVISLLISSRVIPFFTQRRLPNATIALLPALQPALLLIGVIAIVALCVSATWLTALALLAASGIVAYQLKRWYHPTMWQEPLLWILHIGYACIGLGLFTAAIYFGQDILGITMRLATPIHVIGVDGFAVLIIGMLVRTSQGHLGLALSTTTSLRIGFYCMIACAALRIVALWPSPVALPSLHLSTLFWALSLGIYLCYFSLRLLSPRPDGKV